MRDSWGQTRTTAHCKVCGKICDTHVHTTNGVLTKILILCPEHTGYLMNIIEFGPLGRNSKEELNENKTNR